MNTGKKDRKTNMEIKKLYCDDRCKGPGQGKRKGRKVGYTGRGKQQKGGDGTR
jgi:hypothetical protein